MGCYFPAQDGIRQVKAAVGRHRNHSHAQSLLHLLHGHVVQKYLLSCPEHIIRDEQPLAQILAVELLDQVGSGDQAGDRDGLPKETIDNRIDRSFYITTLIPGVVNNFLHKGGGGQAGGNGKGLRLFRLFLLQGHGGLMEEQPQSISS